MKPIVKVLIIMGISAFAIVIGIVLFLILNRVVKKTNEEARRKLRQKRREEMNLSLAEDVKELEMEKRSIYDIPGQQFVPVQSTETPKKDKPSIPIQASYSKVSPKKLKERPEKPIDMVKPDIQKEPEKPKITHDLEKPKKEEIAKEQAQQEIIYFEEIPELQDFEVLEEDRIITMEEFMGAFKSGNLRFIDPRLGGIIQFGIDEMRRRPDKIEEDEDDDPRIENIESETSDSETESEKTQGEDPVILETENTKDETLIEGMIEVEKTDNPEKIVTEESIVENKEEDINFDEMKDDNTLWNRIEGNEALLPVDDDFLSTL